MADSTFEDRLDRIVDGADEKSPAVQRALLDLARDELARLWALSRVRTSLAVAPDPLDAVNVAEAVGRLSDAEYFPASALRSADFDDQGKPRSKEATECRQAWWSWIDKYDEAVGFLLRIEASLRQVEPEVDNLIRLPQPTPAPIAAATRVGG